MEKRIGTVGDAARIAVVSVPTIRTWEKAGKLHAYRLPSGVRLFDLGEVEQLARLPPRCKACREKRARETAGRLR